nr:PREDICTED: capZ-interacting protein-like isoform X1 [Paralichthys olivaceus]XP_019943690.1 PREDICTED: capZ-interacting protein-like isoform X1 [Paralichthys olivaceus]XP_019943691.1 PREDICTED: capZ-interacting protein-like isoform X1 [Paralichthys olivaceus]
MEKDSPSKPSVAELAGRFKGHILPMPATNDELFRSRPPCSLKLQNQKDDNEESDKTVVSPNPFKIKMRNSPIIEKLQANLALSPTSLLPSPKSPEVKLQPAPLSPTPPGSPLSPTLRPSHQSSEEEDPIGFDGPPEGAPLQSFNKTRARLSFKRRPPTRQHRRSAGEEAGAFGSGLSQCDLYSPEENGDRDQVFHSPAEEDECGLPGSLEEAEDMDCAKTENKVAGSDPDNEGDREEEQEAQHAEDLEEEQQPSELRPPGQIEGSVERVEERRHQERNDEL